MSPSSPVASPHYAEYARSLRELHALIAKGQGDSTEADEIRDTMDASWARLSPDEADRLRSLSADLNALGEARTPREPRRTREEVLRAIQDAEQRQDWEWILTLLRENGDVLPGHQAAYIRGRCREELGEPDLALLFFEEAFRLDPGKLTYFTALLRAMTLLGLTVESARLAVGLEEKAKKFEDDTGQSRVIVEAARKVLDSQEELRVAEDRLREAHRALQRAHASWAETAGMGLVSTVAR